MTTDDEQTLPRRLVACKHFRWMQGMRDAVDGDTCIGQDAPNSLWQWAGGGWASINEGHEWLPDLADPATLGCLLALVREAWGDDTITTTCGPSHDDTPMTRVQRWAGTAMRNLLTFMYRSRAEALVAALEAAP